MGECLGDRYLIVKVPHSATDAGAVRAAVDASLRKLGRTRCELLLLHWPANSMVKGTLHEVCTSWPLPRTALRSSSQPHSSPARVASCVTFAHRLRACSCSCAQLSHPRPLLALGQPPVASSILYLLTPRPQVWGAMEALHTEGRCTSLGVCNFTPMALAALMTQCVVAPAVNQAKLFTDGYFLQKTDTWVVTLVGA